ncbi:E3 ubiquitin-protein ligase RNF181-like protein [Cucumis melo var. makuwa]|uniref:RING-type E3 ubiquitin transferase n=2 Tax=Cucumis melo TaxID=3656 RepID=A0A5A7TLM1_CUCMM|nr:E3 ubiquitin-protein ligase RNF181-like protein [Cucumis melo var. makuwa]TYK29540.1 E3 ubiquitin-protein ligase RNF181-like protein [Cucumis melo var. makuwa]
MSFAISSPIQYLLNGTGFGNGVLEIQLSYVERVISISSVSQRILYETQPIPFNNAHFYLSVHHLQDPLFYIRQFLFSLNIRRENIARQIASYVAHMCNGNTGRNSNFYVIARVDLVRAIRIEEESMWRDGGGVVVEAETVVFDEVPRARRGVVVGERLRKLKSEEEEGDCSVCLDELDCGKREVIRIPCGHVYHESCIFEWLNNNNSCPLCRTSFPLDNPNTY